jgi:hypothetical protein
VPRQQSIVARICCFSCIPNNCGSCGRTTPCSALTLLLHASRFNTQPITNNHPSQVFGQPEGFTQHLSALLMRPQRLFDKNSRIMVLLAMFFPQAWVVGRIRPESRGRNSDRSRGLPTVFMVRLLGHWSCFTEGVISSSGQLKRIHGSSSA